MAPKDDNPQLRLMQDKERYRTATIFLVTFLVIGAAVLVYMKFELDNVRENLDNCTTKNTKLVEITGACGEKQIQELDELRAKLLNLTELKGECLVHKTSFKEWASKESNSTALVAKQAEQLLQLLTKFEDSAAKAAERKDSCDKDLKRLRTETYQLLQNITLLVRDKEKYYREYQMCMEKIISYEQEKTDSS